jgi:hypothetical protein
MKQIFKQNVSSELLFELLEQICVKTDKYYFIDHNSYKKLLYNNLHEPFIRRIKDSYFYSKQFYATRKMTYNSFTTIIRQICKANNIMYRSEIKYNESEYNINYYVYY